MRKRNVKTCILGATFYGLSRLLAQPEDCLLIESGLLPGSEFVDSFNEGEAAIVDVKSDFGKEYKAALSERGLINGEGEIYPAPALFLLCDYLQKARCSLLFSTDITEIKKLPEGYEVTCFNCDGFLTVKAEQIVDTTSPGLFHDAAVGIGVQKSLNVVIERPESASPTCLGTVVRNHMTDADIFRFPVAPEDDYKTARKKLHAFWAGHREALKDCRIVLTANTFAYRMPAVKEEIGPGFVWIPSCGFANLLHAVDKGQEVL